MYKLEHKIISLSPTHKIHQLYKIVVVRLVPNFHSPGLYVQLKNFGYKTPIY